VSTDEPEILDPFTLSELQSKNGADSLAPNLEFPREAGIMAKTLAGLIRYLDGLDDRAPLADLLIEMSQLEIDCSELAEFLRFSNQSYMRNLVRAGPWYNLLILCWKNGQRSPIHDHVGSSCGMRVLRGTLTETLFEFTANGHVKAVRSRDCPPGTVMGSQDSDLHQVSNLQAGTDDLVSMHVYSPPLLRMGTYSLTDRVRGEEAMFLEFCDAAGI
jgi:cysteine dioxygenase